MTDKKKSIKKRKKVIVKKSNKDKSNVNIKIHIDQSKRTNQSQPKKSNIKTLPAFSAAPSSGGNYVRQFIQDPYYTQSQYDQMNMLRNFNYPQLNSGFKDRNQNNQQLIQNNPIKYISDYGNENDRNQNDIEYDVQNDTMSIETEYSKNENKSVNSQLTYSNLKLYDYKNPLLKKNILKD